MADQVNAAGFEGGDAVAVIGLACRLPGAPGPEALWRLLRSGGDAIAEPSPERLLAEPQIVGRPGGFLDQVDRFDAGFFGISPREAVAMDPQQRLMLELGWEVLEDAGVLPSDLAGVRAGVFLGAIGSDYAALAARSGDAAITRHTLAGLNKGMLANRISYFLGLRGPSLTVDTAQSSALVAVHLACESLRSGESALAIAGGVNLNLVPESTLTAERFGGLSPDGRCFTFDARANGYVRGEGGGLVLLKPLSRALADGDTVHAVVRGSAVNSDGATDGLTVPSDRAQEEVVRLAVSRSGIDPGAVQFVELHGTGTKVGDPIEARALGAALGTARPAGRPLIVGSVKTNVGHLEGAAGIAGLLKAVLSIRHREIPPSLNFETPNPHIDLEALNLRVAAASGPWPRPDEPLVAGVSSFGIGGTNCHLILTESPGRAAANLRTPRGGDPGRPVTRPGTRSTGSATSPLVPFVLSGRTPGALREQAGRLLDAVAGADEDLSDLAFSLATTRTSFRHRAVLVEPGRRELLDGLKALTAGDPTAGTVLGETRSGSGGVVFVFPGQGSQWIGMGRELARLSPVYAEHLSAVASALDPHVDWSPAEVLWGLPGAASFDRVEVVQPALFAVMVALARLWESFGVVPDAVIGHSQGEIAAAHIAGALSLEDAAAIVVLRSRAIAAISGHGGGMVSIPLPADQVRARLARWAGRLNVGAVNGPSATVVSGDGDALDELVAAYEAEDVPVRGVRIDYASHSAHVEVVRDQLLELLPGFVPRSTDTAFYSSVTGGLLDTAELDAGYWYRNLRHTVEFERAVRAALADGHDVFVESSPHPILVVGLRQILDTAPADTRTTQADVAGTVQAGSSTGTAHAGVVTGTLRRGGGDLGHFLRSAARLHVHGVPVDWTGALPPDARRVPLPTYAFQRRRHWLDRATATPSRVPPHDPLATPASIPEPEPQPTSTLGARLAGLADEERGRWVLDLVLSATATVLGYADGVAVAADLPFRDLGLDSLGAVELRDRLSAVTGLPVPATVTFDHPTPLAVARFLLAETGGRTERPAGTARDRTGAAPYDEPVALVAMSGRWPGGADTPERLWDLLLAGADAISGFPANRGWDLDALYDPGSTRPGTSYTREGGFLHDADRFDADFFGISPREAAAMDPQQRLLLEASWELLERAGITPGSLRGSRTGVFVGATPQDYGPRLHETSEDAEGYALTGTTTSVVSGRIAYTFGFEGPAVTVDTACSSSLVALHLAVQSLRSGDTDLALAGGVAVMSAPGMFTEFSRQRGLARDGRCKPFAAAADGTAWAEGVGLLLVERLSDAERLGHRVLAVIRGTAINQDGASNGLTAPNGPAQQRVIQDALTSAGLRAADVDVVEAHGTGTTLGDPIEAQAIINTYGQDRPADRPLLIGSVKSNIGHAQAAAGVASMIKLVSALEHGVVPKTLHVDEPSGHVNWSAGSVELLTDTRPWPETGRPRRAALSSFGISGTNAHVIIEQPPTTRRRPDLAPTPTSASSQETPPSRATADLMRTTSPTEHASMTAAPPTKPTHPAPPSPEPQTGGPESHTPETGAPESDVPASPAPANSVPGSLATKSDVPGSLATESGVPGSRVPESDVPGSLTRDSRVPENGVPELGVVPWVLSARTPEALRGQARKLADHLDGDPELDPASVGLSLVTTRTLFNHRAVLLGTGDQLTEGLHALADGRSHPTVTVGAAAPTPRTAFLFTGQGSQHAGMSRELHQAFPVYATTFDQLTTAFDTHLRLPVPLREVILTTRHAELLNQTLYTQPALFTLQISLTHLLNSWGITPDIVTGHSIGAISAAHIAGILTLNDATTLIATRAHLMQSLPTGHGAMAAIQATEQEVQAALHDRDDVTIAALNTPNSTVISGDYHGIHSVTEAFRAQGRKAKHLTVSHAFHSAHMDPILSDFRDALSALTFTPPTIDFVSDLTGELADPGHITTPGYWADHLRSPVRFHDAVRSLHATAHLELGPDGVLTTFLHDTLDSDVTAAPVLRKDRRDITTALTAAATTFTHGTPTDWTELLPQTPTTDLPTYAFQRRRHWLDAPRPANGRTGPQITRDAHAGRGARSAIDSWCHRIAWRPLSEVAPARHTGRWLLVRPATSPAAAWSDALIRAFATQGGEAVPVTVNAATADRHTLAAVLTDRPDDGPLAGILSLLSFDDTPHPRYASLPCGGAAEVALIQALDTAGIAGRLWSATREAVSTGMPDPVKHPLQALAWGFGGTLAAERPERWGGLLDLPGTPDGRFAALAVSAVTGAHGESELAVRTSGIHARRLVPAPLGDTVAPAAWTPGGTTLITGGTGALGARIARRLAERGAGHLLLTSRRGPDAPGAAELRDELTALGAEVTIAAVDVSDRAALAALLDGIDGRHPLSAVIHTAAVLDDSLIDSLTAERMHLVQRVKVGGALHLHELTRHLDLSAFVLFSSITGTIGTAGQGNYGPGNAVLDALAEHRRAAGLPATSIAWGHWDGEGIAGPAAARELRRNGLLPMDADLAVTAMEEAIGHGETRLVIARADWAAIAGSRQVPLLGEIPEAQAAAPGAAEPGETSGDGPGMVGRIAVLPDAERRQAVRRLVRTEVAAVLGHASVAAVDERQGFRDQGFSSLSGVELRNRLAKVTGLALPSTLVFDYPTPAALAEHLHDVLASEVETPLGAVLAKIEELEALLSGPGVPPSDREATSARLRQVLAGLPSGTAPAVDNGSGGAAGDLSTASDDELISFISDELGIS
ncbi:SDR family NAD(P)-dependent oxidoreductase [Sphaerisporangium viridialbum]|uniref:SDR family NAD(P)-dependent oxidoreductase n=1 Tax=Sphaerisporangium viridialbum TaxID=46189 RepID=UPI003C7160E4